jgi:hypothetical protein
MAGTRRRVRPSRFPPRLWCASRWPRHSGHREEGQVASPVIARPARASAGAREPRLASSSPGSFFFASSDFRATLRHAPPSLGEPACEPAPRAPGSRRRTARRSPRRRSRSRTTRPGRPTASGPSRAARRGPGGRSRPAERPAPAGSCARQPLPRGAPLPLLPR